MKKSFKMKKAILFAMLLISTGAVMTSCNKENDGLVAPDRSPVEKTVVTSGGSSSVVLFAGQTTDVGTVSFDDIDTDNDGTVDALEVTYNLTNGWEFSEIHFWMGGTLSEMPSTRSGNPQIGQFPYNFSNVTGLTTYSFEIPFSSIGFTCGSEGTYFVASHASVRLPDGNGGYQNETAWGDGERLTQRGNWAMYYSITITCDDPQGPFGPKTTETAFAYNSSFANTFISLNFNGRWGWTNGPLSQGTYTFDLWAGAGQNDLSKGTLVGDVTLTYSGSNVTVTYQTDVPYLLEEVHVYVGNEYLALNNGEYTIAPGQYPYTNGDLGGVSSYVFNISNMSGDVYMTAHATVSGF